jgi:hypothetical protein
MATKIALTMYDGEIGQLKAGDTLDITASSNQQFSATNQNAGGAITIGQPVYIQGADMVDLALADAKATSGVIGLVSDASIDSSAVGTILTDGILTSTDWTAVVGEATLTAGSVYFLSDVAAGTLTTTAPTTTGSFVTRVGTAISTTTLEVTISRPIGL